MSNNNDSKEILKELTEKNPSLKIKKKQSQFKSISRNSSPKVSENNEVLKLTKSQSKLENKEPTTSNIQKKLLADSIKGSKKEVNSKIQQNSAVLKNRRAEESRAQSQEQNQEQLHETPMTHLKPPLPRQNSSQDDPLLNDKIETIRLAHEKRVKERLPTSLVNNSTTFKNEIPIESEEENIEKVISKKQGRQKFRILYRSASSHPPITQKITTSVTNSSKQPQKKNDITVVNKNDLLETESLCIIPISHYPGNDNANSEQSFMRSKTNPDLALTAFKVDLKPPHNKLISRNPLSLKNLDNSTTHRYYSNANTSPPSSPPSITIESNSIRLPNESDLGTRRSRFCRRSSIVPDKEMTSQDESSSLNRSYANPIHTTTRPRSGSSKNKKLIVPPAIDYITKQRPRLTFGRKGTYNGEFHWPRGIAPMPGGEFAVADSSNHRIQIFNKNGKSKYF